MDTDILVLILIILNAHPALSSIQSPELVSKIEDSLDKLLVADTAFWADQAIISNSDPMRLMQLYHDRMLQTSKTNEQKEFPSELDKTTVNDIAEKNINGLHIPVEMIAPWKLYERTTKTNEKITTDSNSKVIHRLSKREDLPFIYQRDKIKSCTNAASTSIISGGKAMDFAAFAAGVLTLVLNVNNNINNNNNNNNNLNINAVDSSNIVANFNTNNANQVNIMPPGRRKKRSVVHSSSVALLAILQLAMDIDQETDQHCQMAKLCMAVGAISDRKIGVFDKVLWSIFSDGVPNIDIQQHCEKADKTCSQL